VHQGADAAVALQAATDVLDGLAVELAGGQGGGNDTAVDTGA
jgi:hypothetical protein